MTEYPKNIRVFWKICRFCKGFYKKPGNRYRGTYIASVSVAFDNDQFEN